MPQTIHPSRLLCLRHALDFTGHGEGRRDARQARKFRASCTPSRPIALRTCCPLRGRRGGGGDSRLHRRSRRPPLTLPGVVAAKTILRHRRADPKPRSAAASISLLSIVQMPPASPWPRSRFGGAGNAALRPSRSWPCRTHLRKRLIAFARLDEFDRERRVQRESARRSGSIAGAGNVEKGSHEQGQVSPRRRPRLARADGAILLGCGTELRFGAVEGETAIGTPVPAAGSSLRQSRLVVTTLPIDESGQVMLIRRGTSPATACGPKPAAFSRSTRRYETRPYARPSKRPGSRSSRRRSWACTPRVPGRDRGLGFRGPDYRRSSNHDQGVAGDQAFPVRMRSHGSRSLSRPACGPSATGSRAVRPDLPLPDPASSTAISGAEAERRLTPGRDT